jgi:hypothetical protein
VSVVIICDSERKFVLVFDGESVVSNGMLSFEISNKISLRKEKKTENFNYLIYHLMMKVDLQ